MKSGETKKHVCKEVEADRRDVILDGLSEMTEYLISVTAISDEFFEQLPAGHEMKRTRQLPQNKPAPESEWLPSSSVVTMTSGTEQPTDVRITKTSLTSVTITWNHLWYMAPTGCRVQ